ncbi:MAG: hypothetical protein ACLTK8_08245 [Paeniclostridium sp.]
MDNYKELDKQVTLTNATSDVNGFVKEVKFILRNLKIDSNLDNSLERLKYLIKF